MQIEELKESFLFKMNEEHTDDRTVYRAVLIKNVPSLEDFYQVFWKEEQIFSMQNQVFWEEGESFFKRKSTDYNIKTVRNNIKDKKWIVQEENNVK